MAAPRNQAPIRQTVAVVLKGYPRLSETFIAQELRALERRGLRLAIFSLRRPTDPSVHPVHSEIEAPVDYLPEYLHEAPLTVLGAWWRARRRPGYTRARDQWLADLRREPTRNRIRRFGQACVLACRLGPEVDRLYAHFLHTPASVARYAALITGLPWCCSAHAKDIWTSPDWEKREKLASAAWCVTCTAVGRDHLAALAPAPERVALVYHGLDFARFPPRPVPEAPAPGVPVPDGSDPNRPVVLLSVGRAVEKKGYDDLLRALATLPQALHWRLVHIGGGALSGRLKALAGSLGLLERIEWRGAQAQSAVLAACRAADLFVLASRIAGDGDRDGLPNVLMEAQSQALACLSTRVSAIPELIEDGRSGVLVPPGDVAALAAALAELIAEPARRRQLGLAGEQRVRAHFDLEANIERLFARLASSGPVEGAAFAAGADAARAAE